MAQRVKNLPAMQTPEFDTLRKSPEEENGYSLQYSCLENSMDRGAWWATVHRAQRVRHNIATKQQMKELMTTSSISIFLIFRTQGKFSLSEKKAWLDDWQIWAWIQTGPLNSYLRLRISWWLWTFVSSSAKCELQALLTPSGCEEKEWDNLCKALCYHECASDVLINSRKLDSY